MLRLVAQGRSICKLLKIVTIDIHFSCKTNCYFSVTLNLCSCFKYKWQFDHIVPSRWEITNRPLIIYIHNCCCGWEGWDPVNRFNHTSWVAVFTLTDRPKSVRNRCVIEVFGGIFVLYLLFLEFSVGVTAFVKGLSQIFSLPITNL